MKIAITGSSGHIGGMVARHLSARGLPLILPLRPPPPPKRPICPLAKRASLPTAISSWPGRR